MRLLDRQRQIPNGLRFFVPQTKWSPPPYASFDTIVSGLLSHLQGNPRVAQQLGWPLDRNFLADRIDEFNASLCKANGWTDFYTEGGLGGAAPAAPFFQTQPTIHPQSPLKNLAAGASSIEEMFGPEGPLNDQLVVEKRAAICAKCQLNEKGDWTRFFTVPAANAMRAALSLIQGRGLKTSKDDELRICAACSCPLKLKIHARISHIVKHIPQESKEALDPKCWIRAESGL